MVVRRLEPARRKGLILVITGGGKGKTTAALGIAVRSCGHGMKVCIIQFIKGDLYSGEQEALGRLGCGMELHLTGKGFCCGMGGDTYPFSEHRRKAQEAIGLAREKMDSGAFDVLILDEINNALHLGLLDLEQVLSIMRSKPEFMHLVLTGRDAHPRVIEMADTVSEVVEVKHSFRKGIEPQPGIDY